MPIRPRLHTFLPLGSRRRFLAKLVHRLATRPGSFGPYMNCHTVRNTLRRLLRRDVVGLEARLGRMLSPPRQPETARHATSIQVSSPGAESIHDIDPPVFRKPTASPEVSIIIPVHNQWRYTCQCLHSLSQTLHGLDAEIIVVDDASTDETAELLAKVEGVTHLPSRTNLGFLRGCNRGARAARGEFLVFLNNDTRVMPGWLDEMLATARGDASVALVGPKVIAPDGTLQCAGWLIDADGWGHAIGLGDDPERSCYNFLMDVDSMTGSCFLIRRSLFFELGMLDEEYAPAFYEEFDLAFTAMSRGYRIVTNPRSRILHFGSSSYGPEMRDLLSGRNHQTFTRKWAAALSKRAPADHSSHLGVATRAGRPVILFIDDKLPDHDRYAGSLTMFHYVEQMRSLGFRVVFLPDDLRRTEPYASELEKSGVEAIYGEFSFDEWLNRNGRFVDVVWLSRPAVAAKYLDAVRKSTTARILYYTHDLHHLRIRRHFEVQGDRRLAELSEAVKDTEFRIFREVDVVMTPSDAEKAIIDRELPKARVEVVPPWIYRTIPGRASERSLSDRRGLLFVGGFAHEPNVDAVLWFVAEIFPLIRKRLPNASLTVIGADPPDPIRSCASEAVLICGHVADLVPEFARARVLVAPLRFGAGVKGKLVTSMAHGLPFVTTSTGNEGLRMTDGEDAFIADSPEDFAARTVTLATDEEIWMRMSDRCLERIRCGFSPAAATAVLARFLDHAACTECGGTIFLARSRARQKCPSCRSSI